MPTSPRPSPPSQSPWPRSSKRSSVISSDGRYELIFEPKRAAVLSGLALVLGAAGRRAARFLQSASVSAIREAEGGARGLVPRIRAEVPRLAGQLRPAIDGVYAVGARYVLGLVERIEDIGAERRFRLGHAKGAATLRAAPTPPKSLPPAT